MGLVVGLQAHEIIGVISSLLLVAFGIFSIAKMPRRIFNWSLAAFSFGVAGFNITLLILPRFPAFFVAILTYVFGYALILPGLLIFIKLFPPSQKFSPRFFSLLLPDIFFLLLLPFGFILRGAIISPEGNPIRDPGPLFPFALAYAIGILSYALGLMFLRWRRAIGLERLRMAHVFLWFGSFLFTVIVVGLVLPTIGIYQLNLFTPLFSSLLLIGILWSALRSRLLDIRGVLTHALSFIALFAAVVAAIVAPVIFLGYFALNIWPEPIFFVALAGILAVVVFTIHPLERIVFRFIQKRFFPQIIMAEETMETFHRSSAAARTFADLGNVLIKVIPGIVPINEVAILYRSPQAKQWQTIGMRGFAPERLSQFIVALRDQIPLDEEISAVISEEEETPKLTAALRALEAGAYIPIAGKNQLLGALVLGKQPVLDAYSQEEIALLEDLTKDIGIVLENVRLWEEQERLLEKLQASHKTQGEFIAVVAHQFRTPLTAIRWNNEVAYDVIQKELPTESRTALTGYLVAVAENVRFLVNALEGLFETMAIDTGEFKPEKRQEPLWEIVADAVKELLPFASAKNIGLDMEQRTPDPQSLNIDKRRVQRVLSVLLQNAIQYTPAHGKVSVEIESGEQDGKAGTIISVKDTGIGIPQNEQSRVFDKFFRGKDAKKISPNGIGLGLYIAKRIIEAHGGKLWFTSEEKKGTTFYVFLPSG